MKSLDGQPAVGAVSVSQRETLGSHMSTIKLQMLLTKDGTSSNLLVDTLKGAGIHITGKGAVTLSAEIDDKSFASVFDRPVPHVENGFSSSDDTLPIPTNLTDLVSQISFTPRHEVLK